MSQVRTHTIATLSRNSLARTNIVLGTLAAIAAIAPSANADFVIKRWTSDTNYELSMSHLPDFDQLRTGLGACGTDPAGANFCMPTSTANLFAYIAQHGDSSVAPGDHDWMSSVYFATVTTFINRLATEMLTDNCDGTLPSNGFCGASAVLRAESGSDFVIEDELWSGSNVVSLREMTRESVDHQAIQQLGYGKYSTVGTTSGGMTVIKRTGGHAMTFTGALRSGTTRKITYSDPSDNSTLGTQSTFTTSTKDCPWVTDLIVSDTVFFSFLFPIQSMNWLQRNTDDGFLRLLDQRMSIRPASAHSWSSYTGLLAGVKVATVAGTFVPSELQHLDANAQGVSVDIGAKPCLALSPSAIPYLLVPGLTGGLFVEQRDSLGVRMVPLNLANAGLPSTPISTIAFHGDRNLLALCGRSVYAISGLDGGKPGLDDMQPQVAWHQDLPFDAIAIVPLMADASDSGIKSLVISNDLHTIMTIGGDPAISPVIRTISQQLQFDTDRIDQTTIVADRMGTLWFAQAGDAHLIAVTQNGNYFTLPLPVTNITGLAINDLDDLLVADNGVVRCFTLTPNGVVETGLQRSKFAGQQVGNGFMVARSGSNYEPRFQSGPGWGTSPEPTSGGITCTGDVDGSGAVDASDMAMILGAWNSVQNPNEDLDHDGVVGASDLTFVLANWGACR